ncbi:hypothetical protein AB835_10870 [Candidatus Endobugula sertula]|uniref:TraD/TraG TraM recognition site domain-containing protein n=1 Tax=Candidatus Endobugula sertula TaxID=62101 RepID=A0A1D2QN88_9GAMM|nr:hypothetical protein AB835_10870 [Candidatus Endobugula sertula]
MQIDDQFHTLYPHGSSHLGTEAHARQLSQGKGCIAKMGETIIRFRAEEPTIIFGGAGSGKMANIGGYTLAHPSIDSVFMLDMGAQYMSTSWHYQLKAGRTAYAINPEGAGAYPDINHPVHLWGVLKNDTYLFDNAKRIAAMALIEIKGDNSWVYTGAMRWLTRLLISLVCLEGRVTPMRLWALLNRMDSDDEFLKEWGRQTEELPYDVYSCMVEIYSKKHTSEKEYGAIMGKLKDDLDWLSSPAIAESISGEEDYLAYLADPSKKVAVYYALKGGSGKHMKSLTRMVVGIAMLHCIRAGLGARPLFYLEEAATCGKAEFIKQAVSECRKYFHTILVYQSRGQLEGIFGKGGKTEILESCGQHIYLGGGIRDVVSAKEIAEALGKATIYVNDPMKQAEQASKALIAMQHATWEGGNPIVAAETYDFHMSQSRQQQQAGRYLIDPAELMRLKQQVLILTPSLGLPPLLADKLPPYWENPMMAGRFAPDPLFPPLNRVTIRKANGRTAKRRVIRKKVPRHLAHLPNHSAGYIAYVDGYKTW